MIDDELLKSMTIKARIAIKSLLAGAMAGGTLRITQKGPDIFCLQAQVAEGTYVTINVLDLNAIPVDEAKQTAPESHRDMDSYVNEEEPKEPVSNVIPLRPRK